MIILLNFKTTRRHRLPTSHFTAGMLFWLNMWTCSSQPCVKVPNPSYNINIYKCRRFRKSNHKWELGLGLPAKHSKVNRRNVTQTRKTKKNGHNQLNAMLFLWYSLRPRAYRRRGWGQTPLEFFILQKNFLTLHVRSFVFAYFCLLLCWLNGNPTE